MSSISLYIAFLNSIGYSIMCKSSISFRAEYGDNAGSEVKKVPRTTIAAELSLVPSNVNGVLIEAKSASVAFSLWLAFPDKFASRFVISFPVHAIILIKFLSFQFNSSFIYRLMSGSKTCSVLHVRQKQSTSNLYIDSIVIFMYSHSSENSRELLSPTSHKPWGPPIPGTCNMHIYGASLSVLYMDPSRMRFLSRSSLKTFSPASGPDPPITPILGTVEPDSAPVFQVNIFWYDKIFYNIQNKWRFSSLEFQKI